MSSVGRERHVSVRPQTRARSLTALGAGLLIAATSTALAPLGAQASSHREAPLTLGLPQLDNTDVYAFVSPGNESTVTLAANWIPFEEPAGGPNFYPFATHAYYNIHIDNNGDAKPDITYRWEFYNSRTPKPSDSFSGNGTFLYNNGPVTSITDPNLLFRQTYSLKKITKYGTKTLLSHAPVAPSYVGDASMPNYTKLREQAVTWAGKNKSFAGQADDPFFLDLRLFDLLYGGDLSEVGNDTLAGYNVNSVALQVPKHWLTANGDSVIGVWSTTSRENSAGKYVQVSRLGNPLVNEVVVPYQKKNAFNRSMPSGDTAFLDYVVHPELPKIIEALYKIKAPKEPRNDLVKVFLTGVKGLNQPASLKAPGEELRLNVNQFADQKYSRLGVLGGDNNGFPNGRRLGDDVLDIELQAVEGELVGTPNDLGDAVNRNDVAFMPSFPYLALPHSGSDPRGAAASNSNSSVGATPLTGGNVADTGSGSPVPVLPLTGLTLGLLLAGAGILGLRRRPNPVRIAA